MNQDILLWIPVNILTVLAVHFSFSLIGAAIKIMNTKHLTVRSFICAFVFGFFYFLSQVWDLDGVILDFRPHKEVDDLNHRLYSLKKTNEDLVNNYKQLQSDFAALEKECASLRPQKTEKINS